MSTGYKVLNEVSKDFDLINLKWIMANVKKWWSGKSINEIKNFITRVAIN